MHQSGMIVPAAATAARPSGADAFRALAVEVRSELDESLAPWLRRRVAEARLISDEVGAVAEAAAELTLRGGKRLRAVLVAVGFEAGQRPEAGRTRSWRACVPAMIAIELLQTYLLIHDDWMDDDDVRRGGPAVHVQLRQRLGARALGDAAAVLAGDLTSGYAQSALLESDVDPERLLRAARVFARIQVEVVSGQVAEFGAVAKTSTPAAVETVHTLKTASYTTTGPLLLGAALAGASETRCAELQRFAQPLGVAFQLRDDVLGVFGDPSATGKPIWNDIRQGKRTALVEELAKEARAESLLARGFGRPDAPQADVEAIVRAMEDSGAKARVESRIVELCNESRRVLDGMAKTLSESACGWLRGASDTFGERAS
jgi:geranylgeranyl diphosphate synthase type I